MKKSTRRQIAKDTLQVVKQGNYRNTEGKTVSISKAQRAAEQQTRVYAPEELKELLQRSWPRGEQPTRFEVVNATTLDTARQMVGEDAQNLLCLNFASAKNPGGGFLNGSQAQEESLARASGLYNCQLKGKRYYDANRNSNTCLYTDYMIYSPGVPVVQGRERGFPGALCTRDIPDCPSCECRRSTASGNAQHRTHCTGDAAANRDGAGCSLFPPTSNIVTGGLGLRRLPQ